MSDQPKDVRLPVMVTKDEAEAIDEWRFRHRIPTRAEAMRRLMNIGLVLRKFVETKGIGDAPSRIAYVTDAELLPRPARGSEWREVQFEISAAPGFPMIIDAAARTGRAIIDTNGMQEPT